MKRNTWYIVIAVVIVVAVVVGWLWRRNANAPTLSGSPLPLASGLLYSPAPSGSPGASVSPTGSSQPSGNSWEGKLQVSDNATRGSLLLMTQVNGRPTNIYIRTARDFGALVGKDVIVTYDGTLDKFVLLNIVAK